ncbi:hypothetical protein [Deinococcus aquaticus]|uniref:hypothetical protein n=1 Tax=Deinococcus aquaticus TaxID=328692 RepID=UPI003F464826
MTTLDTRLARRKVLYVSAADLPDYDLIINTLDSHPSLKGKGLKDSEVLRVSVHVLAQMIDHPAVQQLFLQQITQQRTLSHQLHAQTMKKVKTGKNPGKAWRPEKL